MKPIIKTNGRYFYGTLKLKDPYSLEIPFSEMNDEFVSSSFKRYKNFQIAAGVVSFVPIIYLIYLASGSRSTISNSEYWTIYGISIGCSITLMVMGNSHLKKAIESYNLALMGNRFGVSMQPLPNKTFAYSLGYSIKF